MRSPDSPGAPRRRACPPPPGGGTRRALARAATLVLLASLALTASAAGARLPGSGLADYVRGTKGPDRISLRGGDDRGFGGGGADRLSGGRGDDRLRGGRGRDRAAGNAGADALAGGPGADRLRGGPGDDLLDARGRPPRRRARRRAGEATSACSTRPSAGLARGCEAVVASDDSPERERGLRDLGARARATPARAGCTTPTPSSGPDGKRYPAWHPPRVTTPRPASRARSATSTGATRPAPTSRLGRAATSPAGGGGGVPFGVANEALDAWAAANPGYSRPPRGPRRPQGRVGERRRSWSGAAGGGRAGSGSAATSWSRCTRERTPPTRSATTPRAPLRGPLRPTAPSCSRPSSSASGRRTSSSAPATRRRSSRPGPSHATRPGGGARLIPDRACVEQHLLVPAGSSRSTRWASTRTGSPRTTCGPPAGASSPTSTRTSRSSTRAATDSARRRPSAGRIDVCFESEPGRRQRPRRLLRGRPGLRPGCRTTTPLSGVRRRPPRGLLQPDRDRERRRPAGAGGPIPTAATPPRRPSRAPSASSSRRRDNSPRPTRSSRRPSAPAATTAAAACTPPQLTGRPRSPRYREDGTRGQPSSSGIGSTALVSARGAARPLRASKWRCGPQQEPVQPSRPSGWPACTGSPTPTSGGFSRWR